MRVDGDRLVAEDRVLRRIGRAMVHGGRPMSGALKPRKIDAGQTSVHDGALVSGPDAAALGIAKGEDVRVVVSFTVGQVDEAAAREGVDVPVLYAPRPDDVSHTLLNMSACGSGQASRVSAALLAEGAHVVEWEQPD